ncbi:MAG: replicative DNA helicase [Meiothermus sp.]
MATTPIEGRIPPHNLDAEASVLGSVLLDSEVLDRLEGQIAPEAFYKESHRKIWSAMSLLRSRRDPVDLVTLSEELRTRGELEEVGGYSYLVGLSEATPTAAYAEYYGRIVAEKWTLRKLIGAAGEAMRMAYDEVGSLEDILDSAGRMVLEVSTQGAKSEFQIMRELVHETFEHIEWLHENKGQPDGVRSGFRELDTMIGGLTAGSLNIIAARPSMGKCLTADTLMDVPGTGERIPLEEYIRRQIKCVYGVSDNGTVRPTRVSAWIDSGIKPVWRVTTRTGREVKVTGHHPFLSVEGWKPLHDLKVGDAIAVPRALPVFGTDDSMSFEQVRLIAYFIAEGNLTNTSPRFTNTDPVLLEDFKRIIATHYPQLSVKQDGIDYIVARKHQPGQRKNTPNPLTSWLRELGLMGKNAHQKRFPDLVWRWDAARLAEFLRVLFSCDATIYTLSDARCPRIEFTVASHSLAQDVHHTLVRFGIIAKLWRKTEHSWRVEITEPDSVNRYQERIGWLGEKSQREFKLHTLRHSNVGHLPQSVWNQVKEAARATGISLTELARLSGEKVPSEGYNSHTRRGLPQRRLAAYAKVLDLQHLALLGNPDLYWDTIAKIEYVGERQVYDLTVPDGANFIAQDVCVHNTAFALTIAQNVALRENMATAIFSLEMPAIQLVTRMLCSEARVDMNRLRQGSLIDRDFSRLADVAGRLAEAPILIDDTSDMTLMELRARARRLHSQHKLGLIVIDYLQLMSGPGNSKNGGENRQQEIAQISRGLKGLARELNVPVVALSQLSRAVEARPNKRPMLSDLRESGSIEQDADLVMFIYRDDYYNPHSEKAGIAEIIVGKQRNGPTGTAELQFHAQHVRFNDLAKDEI